MMGRTKNNGVRRYGDRRAQACILVCSLALALLLTGCVDQHSGDASGSDAGELRVVATSMASVDIMDKLDADLIGVPHSDLSDSPERYKDVPEIGMPMAPDLEKLKSMDPDLIVSPNSLEPDLRPKYEAAGLNAKFLDLRSVDGMYRSIDELGVILDREEEAAALAADYEIFLAEYQSEIDRLGGAESPRVLVLMGLPGSYIVATENSYAGSLVKMAGGINVYEGETEEFIAANTEDMATRDPDIILRAAHALPDQVTEMFADEFAENDIWKHFRAVQNGAVYDLPYELFGMSAKFNYPEALDELLVLLYESGEASGK
jgi:iron complex transport system substrate-binding protein